MSILSRALLILALLAVSTLARSDGIGNPAYVSDGLTGGISNIGKVIPQPTGKILLVDGVSHLLLVDAVSRLCRAGGC